MNDEELAGLIETTQNEIAAFEELDRPLTGKEKNLRHMLRLQVYSLERIKAAREKGNYHDEIKAGIDYALYKEYAHRHPLMLFLVKARTRWYGW